MTETEIESPLEQIEALINSYDMDLDGWSTSALVAQWLEQYEPDWLKLAVIEALYQGRYKAFSVQQILNLWQRRGSPIYHFTYEFERLICRNIPTFGTNPSADIPEVVNEVVNISDIATASDLLQTFDPINTKEELTDHETNMIVATLESTNLSVTDQSPANTSKNSTAPPVTHQQLVVNKKLFYNKLRAIARSKELSQELKLTAELPDQLSAEVTTMQTTDNLP
jgi:hypothetical protein